jgi:hypothetical protein
MRRIALLALVLSSLIAGAEVYKWVDANGKVQFSDQPPPGSNAQAVKVKPSSGGFVAPQAAPAAKDAKAKPGANDAVTKENQKVAEGNCLAAKRNYDLAAEADLLRVKDKEGEKVVGSYERADELDRLRKERDRWCSMAQNGAAK